MMWQITTFTSVGPIRFGQSRPEVRAELGDGFQSFYKTEGENETDAYQSLGLHLYYDCENKLEFIEAFAPARIQFDGVSLVGRCATDVVEELRTKGHEGEQDDDGYNFDYNGFGLTVAGDVVEGVGVIRRGYYD